MKHGESSTRLYNIWQHMKKRCFNINDGDYKNYGGRGITICPEWTNDYIKFRDWALNNGYKENLQINRILNDGNYEPNNCDWATYKENNWNRSNNKLTLEIANEIRTLYKTKNYTQQELADKFGVKRLAILEVINKKSWNLTEEV